MNGFLEVLFFLMFVPGVVLHPQEEIRLFEEKCIKVDKEAKVEVAFGQLSGSLFQPPVNYSSIRYSGMLILCVKPKTEPKIERDNSGDSERTFDGAFDRSRISLEWAF